MAAAFDLISDNYDDDTHLQAKTYTFENSPNATWTVVHIKNNLNTGDTTALAAFFVFLFAMLLLGLVVYYSSSLRLWFRQTCLFPCRRMCCESERRRLWAMHKDAVILCDAASQQSQNNPTRPGILSNDEELGEAVDVRSSASSPSSRVACEDPLEAQLDMLVGLEPLKDEIRALRRTLVVEQQRVAVLGASSRHKNKQATAPHMVFRGSPGTGKTMAARLIARLLKELGFVHGDIVEVQRADLVAGYVGQTALKTRAVINMAKGGVLFVDEAYALAPRGAGVGRDFGAEAVQELMRDLTTGDPVVILAGYPDEMERFLRVNPGLSRRFQVRFSFPDYSLRQLAEIFVKIAGRNGYRLSRNASLDVIEDIIASNFGPALCAKWNGGLPEGLFRRSQDALAKRLNVLTMSADAALTLTYDDIVKGASILAATLDEGQPARPVRTRPSPPSPPARVFPTGPDRDEEDEDDDDEQMYSETSNLLQGGEQNVDSIGNVLAALSSSGLQRTLENVTAIKPRIDALEDAVARLSAAMPLTATSSNGNPWQSKTDPPS